LFGAAAAVRRSVGVGSWGRPWLQLSEVARAVQVQLGQQVFDAAWAAAESLALDEAVSEEMIDAVEPEHGKRAARPVDTAPVTPREWEVTCLVSEGLTNRRIGERLVITEGTAALHVRHILIKLGFDSRSQIAAWVSRTISTARPSTYPDR
jgi:non-specific serine/threonine protein kinase